MLERPVQQDGIGWRTAAGKRIMGSVPNYNQRYAFVTSTPPEPRQGYGTATAIAGLMRELNRKGKSIGLVSPAPVPLPPRWLSAWFNLHLPRSLSALDADAIVGFDGDGFRYARRRRETPFVAYLHGVAADELPWATGTERRVLRRQAVRERHAAAAADLVMAPSEYSAHRACELYQLSKDRVAVVPNGLDLDAWPQRPLPIEGPPSVLCVAQLARRKGVDTLLEAWTHVKAGVPEATLSVIGDGLERSALEVRATADVALMGARTPDEVRLALNRCHVFCLPSRQEGFGIALIEAMATGRPVVSTTAAAIPEVVGDAGRLVPPDDPVALAEALITMLHSRELQTDLAAAGRARVERFSWAAAAARFGELLAAL